MLMNERLRMLRKESCLTQKEVAGKLHIPVSTYANWEQGRRCINLCRFLELCQIFNITANDFINGVICE